MGIQRCVEAISEDLKNIQQLHRDQVIQLLRIQTLAHDQVYYSQKVKITIENAEQVEIRESCRGNKKKENPFSRDSAFLAVSLRF